MAFGYPVMLDLAGRRCVVVGGGSIGEDKARGLLAGGGDVVVVDPDPSPPLRHLAADGLVTLSRKAYESADLQGAFLVIAATDDSSTNRRVFQDARAARLLVNAVDDPQYCDFAVPSVVRRGDFVLTLSTGGKAPALAKSLRRRLEGEFGDDYGVLVALLHEARSEALDVRREVGFEEWAARWESALRPELIDMVRQGRHRQVKESVVRDLRGVGAESAGAGHVWIVGAGPGDPGLITVRGRQALDRADVVVYDRLVDPSLVEGRNAVYVGKSPGNHSAPQEEINRTLIRLAREGRTVVRLKGGDPFVFGRGGEEAAALAAEGIGYTVVSAPTSAIAALAAAGIPVTDRRASSSVAIVTGHCGGPRPVDWRALAGAVDTIVVLMGLTNLGRITGELLAAGMTPQTPAAVVQDGTLPGQRVVESDLGGLVAAAEQAGVGSPSVVVIGEVVRLRGKLADSGQGMAGESIGQETG